MKLSLDSSVYNAHGYEGPTLKLEDVLRRASEFGYEAVEVSAHRPMSFPMDLTGDRRKRLVDLARSLGIVFTGVSARSRFLRADEEQEKEILYIRECCELASDLGCSVVRLAPSAASAGDRNTNIDERDGDRRALREATDIAASHGIAIALEMPFPAGASLPLALQMADELGAPNLRLALDLPNFESQDSEFVQRLVYRAGARVGHSCAFGSEGGEPGRTVPVSITEGRQNWTAFLRACGEVGYRGCLAVREFSVSSDPASHAGIAQLDRRFRAAREFLTERMRGAGVLEPAAAPVS